MRIPKILIVNNASDKKNFSFVQPVHTLLQHTYSEIVHYGDIKSHEEVKKYDGIILSGQTPKDPSHTTQSATKSHSWIKQVGVPMFGFCGGHQIMGLVFGGELIKNKQAETKGFYAAYAEGQYIDDPILGGIHFGRCNTFIVYNKHRDAVSLPPDFVLLATTDKCQNALMKHKTKPIYGAQFHPEDPDYYLRAHGINQKSNQDSDTLIVNFEIMIEKNVRANQQP